MKRSIIDNAIKCKKHKDWRRLTKSWQTVSS